MVVGMGVAIEETTQERHERDALQLRATLRRRCFLLAAEQRLETVRVAQRLRGERRHHLAEADVGIGEGLGVSLGAEEDRSDHGALPLDRNDDDRAYVPHVELRLDRAQHRVVRRVGNEDRLLRLEGALQLRIPIQIDDEIADAGIFIARHEPYFVLLAGEEDG
jgi:hypothetical protein